MIGLHFSNKTSEWIVFSAFCLALCGCIVAAVPKTETQTIATTGLADVFSEIETHSLTIKNISYESNDKDEYYLNWIFENGNNDDIESTIDVHVKTNGPMYFFRHLKHIRKSALYKIDMGKLEKCSLYNVTLQAHNKLSDSEKIHFNFETSPPNIDNPQVIISNNKTTIKWNSVCSNFQVTTQKGSDPLEVFNLKDNANELVIDEALYCTKYAITALSANGSKIGQEIKLPGVPGAITALNLESTAQSINVSWSPPADESCVTGYKLHINIDDYEDVNLSSDGVMSYEYIGLFSCTKYNITVIATSDESEGVPTLQTVTTMSSDVLRPVGKLEFTESGKDLVVSWTPLPEEEACIKKYKVQVNDGDESPTPNPTYTIPDFEGCITYKVIVVAVPHGTGGDSAPTKGEYNTGGTAVPGAVTNLALVSTTHQSVTVSWSPPEISPNCVTGYKLQISPGDVEDVDSSVKEHTFDNLLSCTDYEITVSAQSSTGVGPTTPVPGPIKTQQPEVLSPVGKLEFTESGKDLVVSWTPLAEEEACIKEYKVQVNDGDESPTPNPTYTIPDFEGCITYKVIVVAVPYGTGGDSAPTKGEYNTGGTAVPGAVTNLALVSTTHQSVTVSWTPPEISPNCVTGYKLQISPGDVEDVDSSVKEHTFDNLLSCTDYEITVSAQSSTGVGPTTPVPGPIKTQQPEVLSPVGKLEFTESGKDLVVSWTPLAEEEACIKEYKVQVNDVDESPTSDPTYTIPDFEGCITYKVIVVAVPYGTGGDSAPTKGEYTTGGTAVPGAVTNLALVSTTHQSVTVSWSPPEISPNCVTGYQLQISPGDVEDVDSSVKEHTFDNLLSCTDYEISVSAQSSTGVGPTTPVPGPIKTQQPEVLSPVGKLEFTESGKDLVVSWTPLAEEEACIKEYKVQVNDVDESPTSDPTYTIPDFEGCITYKVIVVAVPHGTGGDSAPTKGEYTTGGTAVPGAVTNLALVSTTHQSVTVSWSPPEISPNCVTGYQLQISPGDVEDVDLSVKEHTFDNLLSCTDYEISVSAQSSTGVGPTTPVPGPIKTQQPEVLSPVGKLEFTESGKDLVVSWTPLAEEEACIKEYKVQVNDGDQSPTPNPTHNISNFESCKTYKVSVVAVPHDISGESDPTEGEYTTGVTAVPGAVTNLALVSTTHQSITVSWSPPEISPNCVTGYQLQISPILSPVGKLEFTESTKDLVVSWTPLAEEEACIKEYKVQVNDVDESPTSDPTYTIPDFEDCKTYKVIVVAVPHDLGGESGPTEGEYNTGGTAVPGPVTNLALVSTTHQSVTVSWSPPDIAPNCVTGYQLQISPGDVEDVDLSAKEHTFDNLLSCTDYEITVSAQSSAGLGPITPVPDPVKTQQPGVLSPVGKLEFTESAKDLIVSWTPLPEEEACIKEYKVQVNDGDQSPTPNPTYTIPDFEGCITYKVIVVAVPHGTGGDSAPTKGEYTTGGTAVPGPVTNLALVSTTHQSITVSWSPPDIAPNCVTGYQLQISPGVAEDVDLSAKEHTFDNLLSCTDYEITVSAQSSAGLGPTTPVPGPIKTQQPEVLSPVGKLEFTESVKDLVVSWTPLAAEKACIKEYKVQVNGMDQGPTPNPTHTILNFESCQTYKIIVVAVPHDISGESGPTEGEYTTGGTAVPGAVTNLALVATTHQSITVSWSPPDISTNCVTGYQLQISSGDAEDVDKSVKEHTFENLLSSTDYEITVSAKSLDGPGPSTSVPGPIKTQQPEETLSKSISLGVILGITFGVIFTGLIFLGSYMVYRKRIFRSNKDMKRTMEINGTHEGNGGFVLTPGYYNGDEDEDEDVTNFTSLQRAGERAKGTTTVAESIKNKKRNRYVNILPFDSTRVILHEGVDSDYINASFIKGYSSHIEYIAAQGPLESTVEDFWRMVAQEKVTTILMLTQLREQNREKCFKYFPSNNETMRCNGMILYCSEENVCKTYIQRKLVLDIGQDRFNIQHFQYTDWPDFNVPEGTENMIKFVKKIRKLKNQIGGVILVHCSAGVGRTGTFISIDILLQAIDEGKEWNTYQTVLDLRSQRVNMVQNEKQYLYIGACVEDYVKNKNQSVYNIEIDEPIYANAINTTY